MYLRNYNLYKLCLYHLFIIRKLFIYFNKVLNSYYQLTIMFNYEYNNLHIMVKYLFLINNKFMIYHKYLSCYFNMNIKTF